MWVNFAYNHNIFLELSSFQKTVFLGIMLGDGCLANIRGNASIRFVFTQSIIHSNYFRFVSLIFLFATRSIHLKTNDSQQVLQLAGYNEYFDQQYKTWYPNGIKCIPWDLESDENF